MDTQYISLDALAARLGLPRPFLRQQARHGRIPHLRVGGRLRFEESVVRDALRRQAMGTMGMVSRQGIGPRRLWENPRDRSPSAADVEDAGSGNPAKDRLPTQKNKGGGAGASDTFPPRGVSN